MDIVDKLDADSYVRAACEGLEEIATDNIGNDFCESWKARCLHQIEAERKERESAAARIEDMRRQVETHKAAAEWERQQRQEAERKLEALEARYDEARDDLRECNAERIERGAKLQ